MKVIPTGIIKKTISDSHKHQNSLKKRRRSPILVSIRSPTQSTTQTSINLFSNSSNIHNQKNKLLRTTKSGGIHRSSAKPILNVKSVHQSHRSPTLDLPKNIKHHKVQKKRDQKFCYRRRSLFLLITLILLTICIATILIILFTRKSSVICNPSCINGGTCIVDNVCQCITDKWTGSYCQTPVRILWTFDNHLNDFYDNYPGSPVNSLTYSSPGINGYGSCLYLNALNNQSVIVHSPPFLNMAYTSFSWNAWVKPTTLHNSGATGFDSALFGQFDQNTTDYSFYVTIRKQKPYFGFYFDDIQGSTVLSSGKWYHLAFIYDYSMLKQAIYVNGVLDVSSSSRGPYQGTKGSFMIGTNQINYPTNHWDGCLDQISFSARAKTAEEILREATLTVEYTFDNNNLLDSGPLGINGSGFNYSYTNSCRVNQCLSLLNQQSYIQSEGLVLLGTSYQSYSFSLWIKPIITTQGTIIHVSHSKTGVSTWCIPMLGFTSSNVIKIHSWGVGSVSLTGPTIIANVWTHVAITYSTLNGLRLWINGTQYGSGSGAYNYGAAGVPVVATVGSSLSGHMCAAGGINKGQYYGYIDEFKLYSRELSSTDISYLANL